MSRIFLIFMALLFAVGCNLTPQQRCSVLRTTSSVGMQFALGKWGDQISIKRKDKIVDVMTSDVMPVLEGKRGIVTRKQMDDLLEKLDKNIPSNDVKNALQGAINSAMVLTEPLTKQGNVATTILDVLKCVMLGALDAFKGHSPSLAVKMRAQPVKLYWPEKKKQ